MSTWKSFAAGAAAAVAVVVAAGSMFVTPPRTPLEVTLRTKADNSIPRTPEETALVDFAMERFGSAGLALPDIGIQFHNSLEDCGHHKGLYVQETLSLHMCSLDSRTMLHELAHAWANTTLSSADKAAFLAFSGLTAWNDHTIEWRERGTEQAAETIAFFLDEDPKAVLWIETDESGARHETYRLLSIQVDTETLTGYYRWLTQHAA